MRRGIAVGWHAVSFLLATVLYFYFTLPRWPELAGHISHPWGTVLRIVTGVLLGLSALPVLFSLRHTRRPEFGTPQLALNLRAWSTAGHVLAAAMIVGAAVVEIWVSLNKAGTWLFGVYGAAAAIAVLSAVAFPLAFLAELPPPPPKPVRPTKAETVAPAEPDEPDEPAPEGELTEATEPARRRLRNRRPGKSAGVSSTEE